MCWYYGPCKSMTSDPFCQVTLRRQKLEPYGLLVHLESTYYV